MTISPFATPRQSISVSNDQSNTDGTDQNGGSDASRSRNGSMTPAMGLPTALKPVGIMNEQNTCFLNSTFQALSATAPLIALLNSSPSGPMIPAPISSLPGPIISANRIPSMIPDAQEPPLYSLLPVTKTFIASLQKAWKMKDAGGGTSGSGETSSSRSMRLHHLLREIARKYDQYDDYMQQDAHELLRHLLDSMEMEEKDIIKRVQPSSLMSDKERRMSMRRKKSKDGISPLPSPAPSPAASVPTSPSRVTFMSGLTDSNNPSRSESVESLGDRINEVSEEERMVPFVDVLFGGLLASVVVCEHCKSVSHTYEGFLDISLSLKGDAPRTRKRDRLKAAFGLKPKNPLDRKASGSDAPSVGSVLSESELSDTETKDKVHENSERNRRASTDHDERRSVDDSGSSMTSLTRNSSLSKFGLKGKSSFGFRKKSSRPSSSSSSLPDPDKTPPAAPVTVPSSPNTFGRQPGFGPTPAQSAYIQRILSAPSSTHQQQEDPLAKLRAANAGQGTAVNVPSTALTGLEESLKAFTSVEVLEGDNAFACRKCWRVKSGKYSSKSPATVPEEDESMPGTTPSVTSARTAPPSISIHNSEPAADATLSIPDDGRPGRSGLTTSRSSAAIGHQRTPSPLRQLVEEEDPEAEDVTDKGYAPSALSADSGALADPEEDLTDGLSDTDSSDDEPPPVDLPVGVRPKMPSRRKSSHFVMRRAFKRYLIAQPPEVLVFHFKRFKQMHKSGLTFTSFYDLKKMDDFVSFPEVFDLAPYLAPNRNDYKLAPTPSGLRAPYMDWPTPENGPPDQTPVMYRLYALVVHLGSMIGGHYIAYVLVDPEVMFKSAEPSGTEHEITNGMDKLQINTQMEESTPSEMPKKDRRVWCYCSDTTVRLASVDEVLAAKAYICFYEKVPLGRG